MSGDTTSAVGSSGAAPASAWERFGDWRRRLVSEAAALPDTLRSFREGVASFQVVSRRLEASTESLEAFNEVYDATMGDTARRSAEAATAVRTQIDHLVEAGSPDRVVSALSDVQRALEGVAALNPLWPRPKREPSDPAG